MSTTPAIEQAAEPVVTATQGLFMVLSAAELRGLPMPFAVRAYDYTRTVSLQFHTRDEVVTWAEHLEADVVDEPHVHLPRRLHATAEAYGEWFDVPIEVSCSVPRRSS